MRVWQLTTYTKFCIHARYFADCSGDCILADFTSASTRRGREGRDEFQESLAPEQADRCTMGNSVVLQARETDHPVPFTPPPFARKFCDEDFAFRLNIRAPFDPCENFWWLEIGGDGDSLNKAEEYNRELIACAFGAWDYIKNSGKFRCENRELDWVGFLAGKRESRRYIGDYTLTQNDVEQATPFEDEVAYGGWSMDDHDPRGLFAEGAPNVQHPIRAPYPIPYRCLSSANVKNLFFAGRNISVTHI